MSSLIFLIIFSCVQGLAFTTWIMVFRKRVHLRIVNQYRSTVIVIGLSSPSCIPLLLTWDVLLSRQLGASWASSLEHIFEIIFTERPIWPIAYFVLLLITSLAVLIARDPRNPKTWPFQLAALCRTTALLALAFAIVLLFSLCVPIY